MEFENERVEFLTGIATLLANKARLKLNTKKLYASDGKAVQELLKLATLLVTALRNIKTTIEVRMLCCVLRVCGCVGHENKIASQILQFF